MHLVVSSKEKKAILAILVASIAVFVLVLATCSALSSYRAGVTSTMEDNLAKVKYGLTSAVGEVENVGVQVQVLTKDMVEQSRNNIKTVKDKLSSALGKIKELLSAAPHSKELIATQEVIQGLNANIESAEKALQAATAGEELNLDKTTKAVADAADTFFATIQKLEDFKDTDKVAAQNAVDQASEILNQAAEEPEKEEEIIREENKPVPTVEPSKKYEPVPVSMPPEEPIKKYQPLPTEEPSKKYQPAPTVEPSKAYKPEPTSEPSKAHKPTVEPSEENKPESTAEL